MDESHVLQSAISDATIAAARMTLATGVTHVDSTAQRWWWVQLASDLLDERSFEAVENAAARPEAESEEVSRCVCIGCGHVHPYQGSEPAGAIAEADHGRDRGQEV